jgi:hypothetical protein
MARNITYKDDLENSKNLLDTQHDTYSTLEKKFVRYKTELELVTRKPLALDTNM